jgi:hypothetical protein
VKKKINRVIENWSVQLVRGALDSTTTKSGAARSVWDDPRHPRINSRLPRLSFLRHAMVAALAPPEQV